jgi:hypothetical protein
MDGRRPPRATRSTREVVDDHIRRRLEGDLEGDLAANYDPEVVLLTGVGVFRGHDGVRRSAALLADDLPDAEFEILTVLDVGDAAFIEWRATAPTVRTEDGADSFVVTDGRIRVQTIHYSLHHRSGLGMPAPHEAAASVREPARARR